jgi:ribosomal protein S18 acetylase RimI-like enzyme
MWTASASSETDRDYRRGVELLRQGEWFAAHEALEDAWRRAEQAEREFLQGLVHVAVAWYQAGRGRQIGCERQLAKARRRLTPYAPSHAGLDVTGLLHSVDEAAGRCPDLPPPRVAPALLGGPGVWRALAFMRRLALDSATQTRGFPFGTVVSDPERPIIWDRNFVFLDEVSGAAGASEVAGQIDRAQVGLPHRRAVVHDEATAVRLSAGFRELGWRVGRFLVMTLEREPQPAVLDVEEVTRSELERSRIAFVREEDEPMSEDAERQLLTMGYPLRAVTDVRTFAHRIAGEAVSWCDLYADGATGQVEDVATLTAHRGHGFATAVVTAAVTASLAAGHDLTFLVVDELDGPKALYERLGFAAVGREHVFFRPPAGG